MIDKIMNWTGYAPVDWYTCTLRGLYGFRRFGKAGKFDVELFLNIELGIGLTF